MLTKRYSDMFVQCNDKEVQQFYWLLTLYLAKCDGIVSPSEVRNLMGNTGAIPFDPYVTPLERKESLLIRLKFLKKYDIKTPGEISRVLTQGLFSTGKFNAADRRYLAEFVEHPEASFKQSASRLKVATSSVFEAYHRLKEVIQFRFTFDPNYPLLKLRHFVVFFKPNESFDSKEISSKEFILSINRDTFGNWMWASFLVPDQDRILQEFRSGLARFARKSFEDHRLYEVRSIGRHFNLSMFDGERWIFTEEALGIGAFKFAEHSKEISTPMPESAYGDKPIKFDRADFLISCLKIGDSRIKNSNIREALTESGYDFSWVTVSKRLTTLKRAGVFFPGSYFSGLGLNLALMFAVECNDELVRTFQHVFPAFPACVASRTDKGVIFHVRTTAETGTAISYLMQSLKDEVDDIIVANRLENIGIRNPSALHKYWNNDRQYWEFQRGVFDLARQP